MALLHVNFFSKTLGMMMNMDVILPQETPQDAHYPSLYLLHGMSDDHTVWQRRTSIERYADEKRIAVIMPTTHLGWYTDMKHGLNYYTFIAKELPSICRDLFPKISPRREDTYAAGLSMGGYGALKLGLLDSETFSAVAALSGAVHMGLHKDDSDVSEFYRNIFGTADDFNGSDNDLYSAAEKLAQSGKPLPKVYMWCGTEDFLYEQNTVMRDRLKALSYDLTYEESAGDHQWKYWDEKIRTVLDWLPVNG
ncbi:MAG: alpha/beta hydrolase family protein [Eubacteriales bacterium]|nr:alpha/beta hydrolase family protein [Eubacteriales bacterium]